MERSRGSWTLSAPRSWGSPSGSPASHPPHPPGVCFLPPSMKHTGRKTHTSFLSCCCFILFVVVCCSQGCYFRKVPGSCHYTIAPACHQTSQKSSLTLPCSQAPPARQTGPDSRALALAGSSSSCPRPPASSTECHLTATYSSLHKLPRSSPLTPFLLAPSTFWVDGI